MAGPTDGPMVAVREFVEGFNANDIDRAEAVCADETSIIDDFPPHAWTGRGSTTAWSHDMRRLATAYGMSDWSVTLDEPRTVTVSEGSAYVVVPIDVRWSENGSPTARTGFLTVALRDEVERWLITAYAWTWD